jgi:4-hydroxy-tetrahydrodipicolinate reductase
MKIALLGYGRMGREIEKIALERGHQIVLIIDADNLGELTPTNLSHADVAIDFSTPASAVSNVLTCFQAGVPVVCGTTGWLDRMDEVRQDCLSQNQTFFYASNYSLGVNLLFAVNRYLAGLMNRITDYEVSVKEIHHIHKLDAPSGTAISIANDLVAGLDRKTAWKINESGDPTVIGINAVREGEVPGTHFVTWNSEVDTIEISHIAKSRKGFAQGAVMAAEYIQGKKGMFTMSDLLGI